MLQDYTLTLSAAETNQVIQAIQELPFRIAHSLLQKIGEQCRQQEQSEQPIGEGVDD